MGFGNAWIDEGERVKTVREAGVVFVDVRRMCERFVDVIHRFLMLTHRVIYVTDVCSL